MIFTTLFLTFATLAHALLLKVFVRDDECEPGARNTLKRALTISAGTLLAGWLLTLVPWVGWPMAFLGWFIVMDLCVVGLMIAFPDAVLWLPDLFLD